MKICALISSHSPSYYTKLTVASLLKEVGKNHDLSIHIGIHSNLGDYTDDLSLMKDFEDICQFHVVDEIDWNGRAPEDIYRYSKMHSKNLINLLKNVRYYDFDLLLILDNDLHIKNDFVTELWNNQDLVGSLFDDKDTLSTHINVFGELVDFTPKISVWNVIISRRLYDLIMIDPEIVSPKLFMPEHNTYSENQLYYDTLSRVYSKINDWNLTTKFLKTEEMSERVRHFFGSSFNYGTSYKVHEDPDAILSEVIQIYESGYKDFIDLVKKNKYDGLRKTYQLQENYQ